MLSWMTLTVVKNNNNDVVASVGDKATSIFHNLFLIFSRKHGVQQLVLLYTGTLVHIL